MFAFIKKFLSSGSNYIGNTVMWPKLGNSTTSMRAFLITSTFSEFDHWNHFFEWWSWFKNNNLRLALGMVLKFYTSVEKEWKLKVRKCWRLIPPFPEITGEKLDGGCKEGCIMPCGNILASGNISLKLLAFRNNRNINLVIRGDWASRCAIIGGFQLF